MAHAFFSPSGAPAAMLCEAKPWRERGLPDKSSEDSKEGTAAHFVFEKCLEGGDTYTPAATFHGLRVKVEDGVETEFHTSGAYPVGPDMSREVQKALDYITQVAEGATIYSEQSMSVAHITFEYWHKETGAVCYLTPDGRYIDIDSKAEYSADEVEPATGTVDAGFIKGRSAHIGDLKYGKGVQVYAESNEQLLMYADAFLEEFDILGEVEKVTLHILQPRLDHFDAWTITRTQLAEYIAAISATARRILGADELQVLELPVVPGEKQCRFCKRKATCDENRNFVLGAIEGEFEVLPVDAFASLDKGFVGVSIDQTEKLLANAFGVKPAAIDFEYTPEGGGRFLVKKPNIVPSLEAAEAQLASSDDERLASVMDAADMIEGYVKAVRAEVERRLLAGKFTDARYKLVEGRQGNRAWIDEAEAEKTLKSMRLKVDEMYEFKVISPTSAEKLLQASNPRKWAKLQPMIGRSDGKPSVAPASDKRPALSIAIAEQFEELPAETPIAEDMSDLV